ncbi:hypothetical protein N7532_004122 [Penicillium argentinense]|uniref:Uncharacterized protein n=1 Tax=Penicillium argentinense TaxID=1131581 RepID=A0A9W9FNW2_9EURO|nr:uncharacterized protein N7532_004122 [Penicillium argentinense]KAJ5103593.1 hypothetical protein N7532_004122 [Penicillium argentinense]
MAEVVQKVLDVLLRSESPYLLFFLAIFLPGTCICAWRWIHQRKPSPIARSDHKKSGIKNEVPVITPLRDFSWQTTEPLQLRPFRGKEKYNLTMAIENLDPSELIQMDNTYEDRIKKRKSILDKHHDIVVATNEKSSKDIRIRTAVSELYTFVLGTYLPTRYPGMFRISHGAGNPSKTFENFVTGAKWPTRLAERTPTIQALEILTQTVDEEFFILLPDLSAPVDNPKYILQAYATCFPSGFNTSEKLGLRLADIHGPVPGYADKLERSMDRFFAKIDVGKFVKRVNWGVTTETDLFAAFGSMYASQNSDPQTEQVISPENLKVDQTVLRCERQTLHRLPQSRALVFAFHTYTYPLQQIKDEGMGEELATAIEGLKKGNIPNIYAYKRGDIWGQAVTQFLKS